MSPVELLQQLIRNKCVNDGTRDSGFEFRSVSTLREILGKPELEVEPVPGRQSAIWEIKGSNPQAPRLLLMAHVDVVPVSTSGWSVDPFAAEISDGFVWGRGAVDMLNLAAAMAIVFNDLQSTARGGDLLFAAVADEESAGGFGAQVMVEEHWPKVGAEYVLTEVAYPGVPGQAGTYYPVSVAEKGPHWTRLRSRGTPGHGSTPYRSDNALQPMAAALLEVFEAHSPVSIGGEWQSWVSDLGLDPDLADPDQVEAALERLAATDPDMARYAHAATHMTISPNIIAGGVKANVIPDEVSAVIDVRALPGENRSDVDLHLRKAMGQAGDAIEIEPISDHVGSASSTSNPLWEAVADAFEIHTGAARLLPTLMPVATDGRFFRDRGSIAFGTGWFDERVPFGEFLTMFHGNNERVSIESVERTARLLRTVVDRFDALIVGE